MSSKPATGAGLRILVTGSSGLVGSALIPVLAADGHRVIRLLSSPGESSPDARRWNPDSGRIDPPGLSGLDAVVHLAGAPTARRWTRAVRESIRDSRVRGTRLLCQHLAQLPDPPGVLVSASAVGYYGNRGAEVLREEHSVGKGFLAEVCRDWEGATSAARERGIRVVNLRLGIVLSPRGGALGAMLPAFRLGLGAQIGNGRQFWSWISLADAAGAIRHVLTDPGFSGAVNAVAPRPVTNAQFTRTLRSVLHKPSVLTVPSLLARIALGELAVAMLLASARVEPARLQAGGYAFRHTELEAALTDLLAPPS